MNKIICKYYPYLYINRKKIKRNKSIYNRKYIVNKSFLIIISQK